MREEVESAVQFLTNMIRCRNLTLHQVDNLTASLQEVMSSHYEKHWFPDRPMRGSGYRCIRINHQQVDPLICKAGAQIGLSHRELLRLLPSNLTLWVDPSDVSYRIGEDGSIGMLYSANQTQQQFLAPSSPSSSSEASSSASSPLNRSQSNSPVAMDCHSQARRFGGKSQGLECITYFG